MTNTRFRLNITGVIQGVGFRPFIYTLAHKHKLTGFVCNSSLGVEIEIQSNSIYDLDQFCHSIESELPPLACINSLNKLQIEALTVENSFLIVESLTDNETPETFPIIPPADSSICNDCLSELFDPKDRRYRFPFINCTNCGPRFTIINNLPYDRSNTSMQKFALCLSCASEYSNPQDRRFHAQPNACFDCGPQLTFEPGNYKGEEALAKAVQSLKKGEIVALKGLGGFQLFCDATNSSAVAKLRLRKHRPTKPLALMIQDIDEAKKYCDIDTSSHELLSQSKRPIVIVKKKDKFALADNLSINSNQIGIMLPYTGLHYILIKDFSGPLVATSGNLSEEPIACTNNEAMQDLKHIADSFLMHNRDIVLRYDDSVAHCVNQKPVLLRKARGYAPDAINLHFVCKKNILALGGHLKSTFCIAKGKQAITSQHLGDLDDVKAIDNYHDVLKQYQNMFKFKPDLLARDLHPDYASSLLAEQMAKEFGLDCILIQHHHAHIASCMTEHQLTGPVIGVALDGLGMGSDETLWGGEFLLCNFNSFKRLAHLAPVAMPGGTLAIKEPWRMMLGFIDSFEEESKNRFEPFFERLKQNEKEAKIALVQKQIDSSLNTPLTSSMGRVFDAVAALLGVCTRQLHEGQAPAELESLARPHSDLQIQSYDFDLIETDGITQINTQAIFTAIASDIKSGLSNGLISFKFHQTVKKIISKACHKIRLATGCSVVCLSGGVFQNRLLLELVEKELTISNFKVYFPKAVPCNDAGLSLGQAAVAAHSR